MAQAGHELGFGVGIAHGYATLGRIGFEGRFDYSAIGTVVNLAARLVRRRQGRPDPHRQQGAGRDRGSTGTEPAGELTLKGFHRPVRAFGGGGGHRGKEQQERLPAAAEMQAGGAAENLRRPVARIVVQERPAAGELVLEVRQPPAAGAAIFVVLAADGERDAIARRAPRSRSARSRCRARPPRRASAAASCRGCDRAGTASKVSCRACGARRAASPGRSACADRSRPGTRPP